MSTSESGRLVFTPRPAPVSPRLRPAYRVALLLEIVAKCHGNRATLLQLHAIDTALTDARARRRLAGDSSDELLLPTVRIDPALNRAVDRAVGDQLLTLDSNAVVKLTGAGRTALEHVREAGVLEQERAALASIPGKVTQGRARLATQFNV